jgi:arginine N-succinyltransferase
MDLLFKHQVLRLGFNYDGPTEVGGLIVDPEFRKTSFGLGRQLSYVRFLFIKMHRALFRDRLLAELLPPLSHLGESLLWEALGRRFTGLSYIEADHISRTNKEFIKTLFPDGRIYTTLFEPAVREVIGAVGKPSQSACRMLTEIGFEYQKRVDPFDGGPHYEARTDDVLPVRSAVQLSAASRQSGLIAHFKSPFTSSASFRAIHTNGPLTSELMEQLGCMEDDRIWVLTHEISVGDRGNR